MNRFFIILILFLSFGAVLRADTGDCEERTMEVRISNGLVKVAEDYARQFEEYVAAHSDIIEEVAKATLGTAVVDFGKFVIHKVGKNPVSEFFHGFQSETSQAKEQSTKKTFFKGCVTVRNGIAVPGRGEYFTASLEEIEAGASGARPTLLKNNDEIEVPNAGGKMVKVKVIQIGKPGKNESPLLKLVPVEPAQCEYCESCAKEALRLATKRSVRRESSTNGPIAEPTH